MFLKGRQKHFRVIVI